MTIYKTTAKETDGKYFWHEYKLEENEIRDYICQKEENYFEGSPVISGQIVRSWSVKDPNLPPFLKQYV